MIYPLLITAFVISTCGLVYELIAGTVASYLLGDSVTQFSTVIGVYLFAMGVGSFLSRYIEKRVIETFIKVELLVGLIGGFSATALFVLFEHVENFRILLYGLVLLIGILVGLEVPLLMRILEKKLDFKELVSQVFTFDYVGALLASLLFPLVLVPHLGLLRVAFLFGIFNVIVAFWSVRLFKDELKARESNFFKVAAALCAVVLVCGFAFSEKIMSFAESATFSEPIIFSTTTPYQRIVITGNGRDIRLYLNGNLQFSTRDEYRYHEALVHPLMASLSKPEDVLVLGGGDGMAVREVLKYPSVKSVQLVDLDEKMTRLFSEQAFLTKLNKNSLKDKRVSVLNGDAFVWLRELGGKRQFDAIIVDFPDPSNFSLGKLYSDTFYKTLRKALKPGGLVVIQSTSPYYAKNSYWCVVNTLKASGFLTTPYHAYVPAFGDWGYVIGSLQPFDAPRQYPPGLAYISPESFACMLEFPHDMQPTKLAVNRLNNQELVHLFEAEWSEYEQH